MKKTYYPFSALIFLLFCIVAARSQSSSLTTWATLSGRIVDQTGSPRSGLVSLYQASIRDGHAETVLQCKVPVGPNGLFECGNLPSGRFILEVWTRNEMTAAAASQKAATDRRFAAANAFYPGVTDFESADELTLAPGGQEWAEVRLPETSGATITGVLEGLPSKTDLRLKATSGSLELDSGIPATYDADSGKFTFQAVPDGHYVMAASWNQNGIVHEARATFAVHGANVDRVTPRDDSFVQVNGVFTSTDVSTATSISLYPRDNSRQKVTASVNNGTFSFPPVPPGQYYLGLPVDQNLYIGLIEANGKDYKDQTFPVSGAEETEQIRVELKQGVAIRGILNDWNPTSELTAQIVAQSLDTYQIYAAPTDKMGTFILSGLRPGEYRIYAWTGGGNVEYRDPHTLKSFEQNSVFVSAMSGTISINNLSASEPKQR
jgi:hypothetical protein